MWKKKRLFFLSLMFLLVLGLSSAATLNDHYDTNTDSVANLDTTHWAGEQFTATDNYTVDIITLSGYAPNDNKIINIIVTFAEANGYPNGTWVANWTINSNDIATSNAFFNITGNPFDIQDGYSYLIYAMPYTATATMTVYGKSTGDYANGKFIYYSDINGWVNTYNTRDMAFMLWSDPDTTPPQINITTPANDTYFTTSDNMNITIWANDSKTNLDTTAFVSIGTLANQTISVSGNWYNDTLSLAGLSAGRHPIRVYVNNSAGILGLNDSYTLRIEELSLEVNAPENITYYGLNETSFNFTFTSSSNSTLPAWVFLNGVLQHSNSSVVNNTMTNITLSGFQADINNMTLVIEDWAVNRNYTSSVFPDMFYGINITAIYDYGTTNNVTDYYITFLNSTGNTTIGPTNQTLFRWNETTLGNTTITLWKEFYANTSHNNYNITDWHFTPLGALTINPNYYFWARDISDSSYLVDWSVYFQNSTGCNHTYTPGTTNITKIHSDLCLGLNNFTFSKTGYNDTISQLISINYTNPLNLTAYLRKAGLQVYTYDESTGLHLPFNLSISNSTTSVTYTNLDYFAALFTNQSIPKGSITLNVIDFNGTHYPRNYYATFTNVSFINQTAYLLLTTSGHQTAFLVQDNSYNTISGARVTAQVLIGSTWVTVEQADTDSSGIATLYLDSTRQYRILVTKTGYASTTEIITPTLSQYTIFLGTGAEVDFDTFFSNILISLVPSVHSFNDYWGYVNWTVLSSTGELEYYAINITYTNGTQITGTHQTTVSGGTINQWFNVSNLSISSFYADVRFKKNGYDVWAHNYTFTFTSVNTTYEDISFWGAFNSLRNSNTTFSSGIIALVIALVVMCNVSITAGDEAGSIAAFIVMLIASVFGWLDITLIITTGLVLFGVILNRWIR